MVDPVNLRNLAWAITTLFEIVLFAYILRRKVHRSHPAFALYSVTVLLQGVVVAVAYRVLGTESMRYFNIAWGAQAVVVCVRWLAVTEITRRVLAEYSGIWRLTSRILVIVAAFILVYSIVVSDMRWDQVITSADRAVELCLAVFIVCMFLFARYYRLAIASLERQLAIGFCLFSCFWVINNSIYQHWGRSATTLWEVLSIFSFLASLLIWTNAVRLATEAQESAARSPVRVSPQQYAELSQRLDSRLQLLNNRLNRLLRSEDSR